eukprot:scaffold13606_cov118-Isochrysis_galbana.AAC.5
MSRATRKRLDLRPSSGQSAGWPLRSNSPHAAPMQRRPPAMPLWRFWWAGTGSYWVRQGFVGMG